MSKALFSLSEVPAEPRARWFLKRGDQTATDRGFANMASASAWIDAFGRRLDWRVGYVFRLRGDSTEMSIVDRNGNRPDAVKPAALQDR